MEDCTPLRHLADPTATIDTSEHGSPRQRLRVVIRFAGGRATRAFADDVLAAVHAHATDAVHAHATDGVLVEAAIPAMLIGAEASDLPCVGLMANLYLRPIRGLPALGTSWSTGKGPLGTSA